MRLDKFLKVSRIIERRSVADSACIHKKVLVNGDPKKSSYDVKIGDIISVEISDRPLKLEVLSIDSFSNKDDSKKMYKIL